MVFNFHQKSYWPQLLKVKLWSCESFLALKTSFPASMPNFSPCSNLLQINYWLLCSKLESNIAWLLFGQINWENKKVVLHIRMAFFNEYTTYAHSHQVRWCLKYISASVVCTVAKNNSRVDPKLKIDKSRTWLLLVQLALKFSWSAGSVRNLDMRAWYDHEVARWHFGLQRAPSRKNQVKL